MNIGSIARRPFFDKFFLSPTMPGFLRLALSDSLSFNAEEHVGGAVNNFHSHNFLKLPINSGLKTIYRTAEEIHYDGNHITTMLSLPDIIQIGGAAAVEYAGGPFINVK